MSNWKGNFLWHYYDAVVINFYCNFKSCIPAGNTNRLWCNCLFRKTGHHNYTCSWLNISSPLKSQQYSQCYSYTISPPSLFHPFLSWDAHIYYEKICRVIPSPILKHQVYFYKTLIVFPQTSFYYFWLELQRQTIK